MRKTATALVLGFLASLLPTCGWPWDNPAAQPQLRLGLRVSFHQGAGSLTIDYRVVDNDSVPVVVFTGVPAKETVSAPRPDPNAVYVAPAGGSVEIAKRLFAVPAGVDPVAQFLLRGVNLAPGEGAAERVVVALPLRLRVPYAGAMPKPPKLPDRVGRVMFCVGAARQDRLRPVPPDSADTDPHPIFAHAGGVEEVQHVSCSAPYDLQ